MPRVKKRIEIGGTEGVQDLFRATIIIISYFLLILIKHCGLYFFKFILSVFIFYGSIHPPRIKC